MKYYLEHLGSYDPFVESRQGFITQVKVNDSMVATRLLTLANGATAEAQDLLKGWDSVLLEVIRFLFARPWHHTSFIKKQTSVLKQMAFANAKVGQGLSPHWTWSDDHEVLNGYTMGPIRFNDADVLGLPDIKKAVAESHRELQSRGLKMLSAAFNRMINDDVTERGAARQSMLVFIEAFCGFMQANEEIAHIKSIDESLAEEATATPKFKDDLIDLWYKAFDSIQANPGFSTYDEWLSRVPAYMTTKSAGGDSVMFDVRVKDEVFTITARDKMLVFLSNPEKYISPELVQSSLTEENPGAIATRRVPARGIRAVFMVPLPVYVAETSFITNFLHYQANQDHFSINSEAGRFLNDHKYGVEASNNAETLILLMDFSGFDTTEKWNNVRQHMIAAAVRWGRDTGLDQVPFGPWKSLIHVIVQVWTKYRSPVFEIAELKRAIDQVVSGEFGTIVNNNFTNYANFLSAINTLWAEHYGLMSQIEADPILRIQGDDSMTIFRRADGWTADQIDELRQVFGDTATSNSLVLNLVKTGVRRSYYEYLKKMAIHGWVIGRLSALMIWCSERSSFGEEPITKMKSYWGLLSEYVSRGGDHDFINLVGHFSWNLMRRVKYPKGKRNFFYTLPFGVMWSPRGIDALPWTMVGASKGAVMNQVYHGALRRYVNYCSYIIDVQPLHANTIVREVMEGGTFDKGIKFMKKHLEPAVVQNSSVARDNLARSGIIIGKWAYDQSPTRLVTRSVADNPKFGALLRDIRRSMVGLMSFKDKRLPKVPKMYSAYVHINESFEWFQQYVMYMRGFTFGSTDNPEIHAKYSSYSGTSFINVHHTRQPRHDFIIVSENLKSLIVPQEGETVIVVPESIWDMPITDFYSEISKVAKHGVSLIKDYFATDYAWQKSLHFMYEEDVPLVHEQFIPIAGMDPIVVEKMKATGISSAGDSNAIKMSKLAAALIRTKSLPNDITSDTLISIVTHPSIIRDQTKIINVLIAMGVDSEAAAKFAADIYAIASRYLTVSTIKTFSTSDQIIGNMDLSMETYERIVKIGPLPSEALKSYISSAAMLYSLIDKNMRMRKTRVYIQGTEISSLQQQILGDAYDNLGDMIDIFPTAPM
jgi:hypothetical protein